MTAEVRAERYLTRNALSRFMVSVCAGLLIALPLASQNTFPPSGNVGAGTTTPVSQLEVRSGNSEIARLTGTQSSGGFLLFSDAGTTRGFVGYGPTLFTGTSISTMGFRSQGDIAFATNGGFLRAFIDTAGKFGIGTSAPVALLDVGGDATAVGGEVMRLNSNFSSGGYLRFEDKLNNAVRGFIGYGPTLFSGLAISDMGFRSQGGVAFATGGGSTRVYISNTGNFGIGTTTPSATLDVNGNVNVSGNIAAKYQDFAEWVPATEHMAPGTVVILNPERPNEVMPAAREYDTSVAGVVSMKPGVILGEEGPSKAQIATMGRVRVRATAVDRPIAIGDLLVTSGKAGFAMKSEPMEIGGRKFHQPGTLIGKALEPLPEGEGEILVLLSLQ